MQSCPEPGNMFTIFGYTAADVEGGDRDGVGAPGGRLHTILRPDGGLKLEGNGSLFSLEGGKWCPPIWL